MVFFIAGLALHAYGYVLRWVASGRAPLSNGHESLLFIALILLVDDEADAVLPLGPAVLHLVATLELELDAKFGRPAVGDTCPRLSPSALSYLPASLRSAP